jgi:cell fate (sporulation/competence/biofilm development) regulator YmcA (YheA/YmcA/DUF963 family)
MEILVFKTNLRNESHISQVMPSLDHHPQIIEWNVDLHDCDNILRVVSKNIPAAEIEQLLVNAGYFCKELQ